jgi:hypothetical protein
MIQSLRALFDQAQAAIVSDGLDFSTFPDYAASLLKQVDQDKLNELSSLHVDGQGANIIRLFESEDLFLNIHYWPLGITNCHCHEFYGAFRIVQGRALHLKWSFTQESPLTDFLSLGSLGLLSRKIIGPDDVEVIELGKEKMIHQMIYLERPTFTLVLRTKKKEGYEMDEFFYPGLRLRSFSYDDDFILRLRNLQNLQNLLDFIDHAEEKIVLAIYSGSIFSYLPILEDHAKEVRDYIRQKYAGMEWFEKYLNVTSQHQKMIQKLLIVSESGF